MEVGIVTAPDPLAPIRARFEQFSDTPTSDLCVGGKGYRLLGRIENDHAALLAALDAVLAGLEESAKALRATSDRMCDEVMTGKELHNAHEITRYSAYANQAETALARARPRRVCCPWRCGMSVRRPWQIRFWECTT